MHGFLARTGGRITIPTMIWAWHPAALTLHTDAKGFTCFPLQGGRAWEYTPVAHSVSPVRSAAKRLAVYESRQMPCAL